MIRASIVAAIALTLGLVLSGCSGSGQSPVIVQFSASPTSLPSGGGATSLSWNVNGATSLSINQGVGAVTPATSGSVSVNVTSTTSFTLSATNSSGTSTSMVQVTVGSAAGPTIASVVPSAGPTSGGTVVTLTGTNFQSGATVEFGTASATGVTFNSATSLSATTPAGAVGAVDVTVTNPDHQLATLAGGFAYTLPAPSITTASPGSGLTAGGTVVAITGDNFQSGATVKFGTVAATGVTFNSATSISATSPAGSFGTVDVTVTNPDTQSATLSGGFSYLRLIEREQSDATGWYWYSNETAANIDTLLTTYSARPVDIAVQTVVSGVPYFNVIFVPNTGAYATTWNWYCCDTATEVAAHPNTSRIISISPYYNGTTLLFASVWVDNTGLNALSTVWAYGSASFVANYLSGYRVVDFENFNNNGTTEYAGIAIADTGVEATSYWSWWYGISATDLATTITNNSAQLLMFSDDPNSGYDATLRAPATAAWWYYYGIDFNTALGFLNSNHARPTSARVNPSSIAGGVSAYTYDVVMIAD